MSNKTVATATAEKLGDVRSHTFQNLDYGYYLVYQTGTKEIESSLISVDDTTVPVNLKGEAPSITKKADKETVEIGQVVTYTIKGIILTQQVMYSYSLQNQDTLTKGLDFVKDADGTSR